MTSTEYPSVTSRVANELRFLSWNVYYGDSASHADDVITALKRYDCDVLALYEVNCAWGLPGRIHALGYDGVFVEANYRRWLKPLKGGVCLYSRYPIEEVRDIETNSDTLLSVRRHYIEAKIRVSSRYCMTVGAIHNSLPFEFGYARACDELFRQVAVHSDRFLLGADLNAVPSFSIVKRLSKQLVHLGPSLDQKSHPTSRWLRHCTPQRRLDYVFGTSDVARMLVSPVRFDTNHPSDHHPLLVRLRMS